MPMLLLTMSASAIAMGMDRATGIVVPVRLRLSRTGVDAARVGGRKGGWLLPTRLVSTCRYGAQQAIQILNTATMS